MLYDNVILGYFVRTSGKILWQLICVWGGGGRLNYVIWCNIRYMALIRLDSLRNLFKQYILCKILDYNRSVISVEILHVYE